MEYTERTREWLDEQVAETIRAGRSRPSYYGAGGEVTGLPIEHVLGLARALVILDRLSRMPFSSVLDVGAGTGWLAYLMREHLAARPVTVDLSREFSSWSRRRLGIPSYVANAAALPFADDSFDVVVCSEVIEHVEHPLAVLGELERVARSAVVVTTQESCVDDWQRRLLMAAAADDPHAERNFFLGSDFVDFFGEKTEVEALMSAPERLRLFDLRTVDDLAACLLEITGRVQIGPGSYGALAVSRTAECEREAVVSRAEMVAGILASDRALGGASGFRADWAPPPWDDRSSEPAVDPVCPSCLAALDEVERSLVCSSCAAVYPVDRGVPILIAAEGTVTANEARQRARPELAGVVRALSRPPWRSAGARLGLRAAVRVQGFLNLPLSYRDKARLAWKVLVS